MGTWLDGEIEVDLGRLLKDIEERCSGAFAELGPRALQHFKHLIECVDAFWICWPIRGRISGLN